jgi:hypothetical protein
MLPSSDLYLLAVLNSPLYDWYARRRFPPALNGSVRPKLAYMREMPIALPTPAQRAAIEELVRQRLAGADTGAAIARAVLEVYELSPGEIMPAGAAPRADRRTPRTTSARHRG